MPTDSQRLGVRTAFHADPVQCKIIGLLLLVSPTAQAWRPEAAAPYRVPPVTKAEVTSARTAWARPAANAGGTAAWAPAVRPASNSTAVPAVPAARIVRTRHVMAACPGGSGVLYDVAAFSSGDAWAVGASSASSGSSQNLIEHWNGHSWAPVPQPRSGHV
jgi:hypothetical protein